MEWAAVYGGAVRRADLCCVGVSGFFAIPGQK
jgi:hypothetical protein